jgi:Ca2+/H+ antiporter
MEKTRERALIALLVATGFIVWTSKVLAGVVEHVVEQLG